MEKLNFYINKKITYVDVIRTTNKNMYLKIQDNKIIVSAHKRVKLSEINKFVSENIEKFVEYLEKSKENALYSIRDKFLYVDGVKKKFTVLTGFKTPEIINGKSLYFHTKEGTEQEVDLLIKDWTKSHLMKYLNVNQVAIEKKMNIPTHKYRATHKNTTWGTNSVSRKSISYSTKLSHYSDNVKEYVVVHELAHHLQPNHSEAFWDIVKTYVPEYKKIRKSLRSDTSMDH